MKKSKIRSKYVRFPIKRDASKYFRFQIKRVGWANKPLLPPELRRYSNTADTAVQLVQQYSRYSIHLCSTYACGMYLMYIQQVQQKH